MVDHNPLLDVTSTDYKVHSDEDDGSSRHPFEDNNMGFEPEENENINGTRKS